MKWIDYREALGIGFSDKEKVPMFSSRLAILIDGIEEIERQYGNADDAIIRSYFVTVFEKPSYYYVWHEVSSSIQKEKTIPSLLSKVVALINAFYTNKARMSSEVEQYVLKTMDDLNLSYELLRDSDGLFVFPKGAKELDDANVSVPFQWLSSYPKSRKAMALALKSYNDKVNPSNTADLFRKALETFGQEFFNSDKSLDNLKSDFGKYLKSKGVPSGLSGNFETTLQMYINYMNDYAKHHDRTSEKFLEFIMYQTGNIIRFIISLK